MGERVKRAIKSGDLEALGAEKLEEFRFDVNSAIGSDGFTALHWACHYGRAEVLQHLLDLGADVTMVTRHGWTGAHTCAIRGCTTCLKVLCVHGVDLTATDTRGYTCAHLAAAHGKIGVLQEVIKTGTDIPVADSRGWTVVHHAAFHGRLDILQLLSGSGVEMGSENEEGNCPAHLTAAEGHLDCLKLLAQRVGREKTTGCRNYNGATPKDLAVQFQKQDCVDFLASLETPEGAGDAPNRGLTVDNTSISHNIEGEEEEGEGEGGPPPTQAKAWSRVEELQEKVGVAKAQFQQLEGELPEVTQQREAEREWKRECAELRLQLELEREQREALESTVDQLRSQLQLTNSQLHHLTERQAVSSSDSVETAESPSHKSSKKRSKKRNMSGGAFVRINHL